MRLTWILAVVLAVGAVAQTPEAMLGAALHQERVTGNLQAAIDGYRKVLAVKGVSRMVAAQAQYHIGICYEKLGDQEARRAFEGVVKNYGDQRDFVSQARARLAAMGGANTGEPRTRLVWDGATDFWGRVSADGRYLSFVDWETGDLAVRDLKAGSSRRVTNYGGYEKAKGEAESTSISPDGKRVVFNWNSWDKAAGGYQLRIINLDGSGERVLRKVEPKTYFEAMGWSPDGKWIATCEQTGYPNEAEITARIVLQSPDTGERKVISTATNGYKSGISFSPDGKWLAYNEPPKRHAQTRHLYVVGLAERDQTALMVAENSALMGWTPRGDGLLIQRNEQLGGQIYLLPMANGKANGQSKVVHVPSVDGATPLGLMPSGELFYGTMNRRMEASLRTIGTANGLSTEAKFTVPVQGVGYANNQGNLRFSPDGKWLASTNSAQSIRIRSVGGSSERIITIPVKEVRRFDWMPDGGSLIASALGSDDKFGLYRIDPNSGLATLLCGIEQGMVLTPAPDGKTVFHFPMSGLESIDLATGARRTLLAKGFAGQGPQNLRLSRDGKSLLLTSFAYIGIYDIASGELKDIFKKTSDAGTSVWVADWSLDGRTIYAVARSNMNNDRDRELLIFPTTGGEPKRQKLPGVYRDFSTSPDGTHAAIVKTESHRQVWVLENFLPGSK